MSRMPLYIEDNDQVAVMLLQNRKTRRIIYAPGLYNRYKSVEDAELHTTNLKIINENLKTIEIYVKHGRSLHRFRPDGNLNSPVAYCAGHGLLAELQLLYRYGADLAGVCDDPQCDPTVNPEKDADTITNPGFGRIARYLPRTILEYALLSLRDLYCETLDKTPDSWRGYGVIDTEYPLIPEVAPRNIEEREDMRLLEAELREKNAVIAFILDHTPYNCIIYDQGNLNFRYIRLLTINNLSRLFRKGYHLTGGVFPNCFYFPPIISRLLAAGKMSKGLLKDKRDFFLKHQKYRYLLDLFVKIDKELLQYYPELILLLSEESVIHLMNLGYGEYIIGHPKFQKIILEWAYNKLDLGEQNSLIDRIIDVYRARTSILR